MRKSFAAITLVLLSAVTAFPQTTDPLATVRQYIDSFNKGDINRFLMEWLLIRGWDRAPAQTGTKMS
jgi:hypothetical protein